MKESANNEKNANEAVRVFSTQQRSGDHISMLDVLIGNEADFLFEHRLFNVVLVFSIIISCWSAGLNYLLNLEPLLVAACGISGVVLILIYYLSIVKKLYKLCLYSLVVITMLVILPIIWIYNGGAVGGIPLYVALFSSIGATLFSGIRRLLVLLALLLITNFLLLEEYQYPMLVTQYPNDIARYIDISISLITVVVANSCLFVVVLRFYKQENKRAISYLARLEKQKIEIQFQNHLTTVNQRLQQEINERLQAEFRLREKNEQLQFEITERIRAEREAREQKRQLETILINSPDIIARYALDGSHLFISEAGKIFSLNQQQTVFFHDGNLSVWSKHFHCVLDEGKTAEFDIECGAEHNKRIFFARLVPEFDDSRKITSVLGFFSDVTSLKRVEKEMARLDRLDIIGQMAASIGHEVRNPMTTVRGFLQLFGRKGGFLDYREEFSLMISELDRANEIITEFLSLAKNKAICLNKTCLNRLVKAVYPLLKADALEQGHDLELELGEIKDVLLDEKEIRQLILNLVKNGFEAMHLRGHVKIRTYEEGNCIKLAVHDNGSGIPDEVQKQLGTPFITTKDKGTGLGLPVCYRIAERHHARLEFETSPSGTTFILSFTL